MLRNIIRDSWGEYFIVNWWLVWCCLEQSRQLCPSFSSRGSFVSFIHILTLLKVPGNQRHWHGLNVSRCHSSKSSSSCSKKLTLSLGSRSCVLGELSVASFLFHWLLSSKLDYRENDSWNRIMPPEERDCRTLKAVSGRTLVAGIRAFRLINLDSHK